LISNKDDLKGSKSGIPKAGGVKKNDKVYVLNPVEYKSSFVNGSRPLPDSA